MRHRMEKGGLAFCATLMCGALGAQDAETPKGPAGTVCEVCLEVCDLPLSHEDDVLDESTDSYMPPAARRIATDAAIDMAAKLKSIYGEYQGGYFGREYEAHSKDIESLAGRSSETEHATSAEIRSLKRVRTALYADTVTGLQAFGKATPSPEFVAAYQATEGVLDGVLRNLSALQQMRAAERLAVCEMLAAYKR
jgi:hypothetical protein